MMSATIAMVRVFMGTVPSFCGALLSAPAFTQYRDGFGRTRRSRCRRKVSGGTAVISAQAQAEAPEYRSEPGVVSRSPVSSSVFRPERIIGQPPYSSPLAPLLS